MYNLEKTIQQPNPGQLEWKAITTGGFGGFDCMLKDPQAGTITIETDHANCTASVADIGFQEKRIDAGGLDRHIRLVRLPDTNPQHHFVLERKIPLISSGDNP